MAEPSTANASSTIRARFVMTPRRWVILSAACFLAATYALFHEHIPVHVTKDTPLFRATRNGKQGIVTTGGRIVVPFEWKHIGAFDEHGLARVVKESSTIHVSSSDPMVDQRIYHEISGVIDRSGRHVIPPILTQSSLRFDDQNEFLGVRGGQLRFFDRQGRERLHVDWRPIMDGTFGSHGLIAVQKGSKTGWLDRAGRLVLSPPDGLRAASNFLECGLALVENPVGALGCIDLKGTMVIDPEWTTIEITSTSAMRKGTREKPDLTFVRVSKGPSKTHIKSLFGLFTSNGHCVVPADYSDLKIYFEPNLIRAKRPDGTYCCLNFDGVMLPLPSDLDVVHLNNDADTILSKRDGKYGWFTADGKVSIPFEFDVVLPPTEFSPTPFAIVAKADKWGVINEKGGVVIPFEYDRIEESLVDFGLFVAREGRFFGCLDVNGKTVVPFEFTHLGRQRTIEYFVGGCRNGDVIFEKSGKQKNTPAGLRLSPIMMDFVILDFISQDFSQLRPRNLLIMTQKSRPPGPYFSARYDADHGGSGIYHVQKGLIVPPVHGRVAISESGLAGYGLVRSDSLYDRYLSWSQKKLNELMPSMVPAPREVFVVYDDNGNVIWRNDMRLISILKALGLSCWGLYSFRKYRVARRAQQKMMHAA